MTPLHTEQEVGGLLPCPFCGLEDHVWVFDGDARAIRCTACKATGPFDWPQKAKQLWNTRAPTSRDGKP